MAVHTHYDNLQVKESANLEVIRGAYRHLAQKWHPDRNPDQRELAEKYTKIINEAYAVLSDPERRREHDSWIAEQRRKHESQVAEPVLAASKQTAEGKPADEKATEKERTSRYLNSGPRDRTPQARLGFLAWVGLWTLLLMSIGVSLLGVYGLLFDRVRWQVIIGFVIWIPMIWYAYAALFQRGEVRSSAMSKVSLLAPFLGVLTLGFVFAVLAFIVYIAITKGL